MATFSAREQLRATSDEITANLRRAQNKAIISEGNQEWGITWGSDNYYIVKDPQGTPENFETYELPANIEVSGSNMVFDKLTGKNNSGVTDTITITLTTINEQKQITINEQGKVETQ